MLYAHETYILIQFTLRVSVWISESEPEFVGHVEKARWLCFSWLSFIGLLPAAAHLMCHQLDEHEGHEQGGEEVKGGILIRGNAEIGALLITRLRQADLVVAGNSFLLFCKCPECGNNCKGTNLCPNTQSECHCRSA